MLHPAIYFIGCIYTKTTRKIRSLKTMTQEEDDPLEAAFKAMSNGRSQ
jgi:hypothetical protein